MGSSLRILAGRARAARGLNDTAGRCAGFRALLDAWAGRAGEPVEIVDARAYVVGLVRVQGGSRRMPSRVIYRYKEDILAQLAGHGVRPTPDTPPELVHEFVNDLYRYELRRLRDRLLRREIAKPDYYDLVVEIRRRYPALALKPWQWIC